MRKHSCELLGLASQVSREGFGLSLGAKFLKFWARAVGTGLLLRQAFHPALLQGTGQSGEGRRVRVARFSAGIDGDAYLVIR